MVLDFAGETHEGLLDVPTGLGAHLQEEHVMLLCQLLRLVLLDFPIICKISFSSNEYLAYGFAGIAFDLFDPAADILKGLFVIHPIGEDDATGSLVVGLRDIPKAFLSGGVPDLQSNLGIIDGDGFDLEVDADGGHVAVLEYSIAELGEEVGLTDSTVPDYDHFG